MPVTLPSCGVYERPEDAHRLFEGYDPRRALFLDRDGVINADHGYVHRPEDTEWIPGVFNLCRVAIDVGALIIVVTNQAGIARGYYSEQQFLDYTGWVHGQFASHEIVLQATCYCPHHPDAPDPALRLCSCRKPLPGMILEAARRYRIDLGASALLGDKPWDVQAGQAAGVGLNLRFDPNAMAEPGVVRTMQEAGQVLHRFFE
ncbi:D-glycero-D-manno-heptose 1,7-bisphosphate phosphatase [Lysobacter sp. OAE881]|uniref:D-glycero-alpha-D-manno-heptose-1,7-bisphosphate 7-phosphatase n=1 Tax=Lysobacter sp. OAE881 TaxID=2663813 RepID=UPI00178A2678